MLKIHFLFCHFHYIYGRWTVASLQAATHLSRISLLVPPSPLLATRMRPTYSLMATKSLSNVSQAHTTVTKPTASANTANTTADEETALISKGYVIKGNRGSYVVDRLLGEGGFGAVYRVTDEKNDQLAYALKIEKKSAKCKDPKLKMEVAILKTLQQRQDSSSTKNSHFTALIDRGRRDWFYFVVMELLGSSLSELKRQMAKKVFPLATGLALGKQCLEAVEQLHRVGFIHRDIKPANFAIGRGEKKTHIYILDFGISRRFLNSKGVLKTPREKARFKGTIKFAPLACHRNQELSTKDDVEAWFYLLIDLINPMGLPWSRIRDINEVKNIKERCRTGKGKERLFVEMPSAVASRLGQVMAYFDGLKYVDISLDYDFLHSSIRDSITSVGGSQTLVWETEPDIVC